MTDKGDDDVEGEVEVEYVCEPIPENAAELFAEVFKKFNQIGSVESTQDKENDNNETDDEKQIVEAKQQCKPQQKQCDKPSKKKLKQISRMTVAELKKQVTRPELVESHDVTAKDPILLLTLKATKNTVPIPKHWCSKRRYLQGKRGYEKPPFLLPEFIRQTGIMEMRDSVLDKESGKTLKAKMRDKIRPKVGKIQMDYQQLHDAFFKWQTKPQLTIHGDLYYEGKEFEKKYKMKPGNLSDELRRALGMPSKSSDEKCPPPWYAAMKRHGPPPSYPYMPAPEILYGLTGEGGAIDEGAGGSRINND